MTLGIMVEILPGILEKTFAGVEEKLARLEGLVDCAQLDVVDGIFAPEESWQDAEDLDGLETGVKFDLHLMVDRPEQWIEEWSKDSIFRITFHHEATYDVRRTARIIKDAGKEAGLALKLETPTRALLDIANDIDLVLLMSIEPGAQGRPFDPRVIDRVKEIKSKHPNLSVGVDGGVTALTAPGLVEAGVDMMVSGSYLFGHEDIKEAIKSLQS